MKKTILLLLAVVAPLTAFAGFDFYSDRFGNSPRSSMAAIS